MNQRIRELINQAGTDVSGKWLGVDNAEKFAQLIIEECTTVIEQNLFQGIGWNTSRAVKKHFGIEGEE
jgi:hypothetical protein